MNIEQRKSFRIQIPEGRELAVLIVDRKEIPVRILDESAGGNAVALLDDVDIQQNQVHLLKTTTGLFQVRVARIEHFDDGKLLGLVRLNDLSDDEAQKLPATSWRDYLAKPTPGHGSSSGGMALGIGLFALIAALVCGLALFGLRYLPAKRSPESSKYAHDFADAVTSEIEKSRDAAAEAERKAQLKDVAAKAKVATSSTAQFARRQAKVSAETLYRLQLTSEQSQRIRQILLRSSSDLATTEAEIRSILTAEQVQKWQTLAP